MRRWLARRDRRGESSSPASSRFSLSPGSASAEELKALVEKARSHPKLGLEDLTIDPQTQMAAVDAYAVGSCWYTPTGSTAAAEEALADAPEGRFLIHESAEGKDGTAFVLSYRYAGKTWHRPVLAPSRGITFTDSALYFSTLTALVRHFADKNLRDNSDLPCTLDPKDPLPPVISLQSDDELGSQWSVDEVCAWLEHIQLQHCCGLFRQNNIGGRELLKLTPEKLREIGVAQLDDRAKIYKAVQLLQGKLREQREQAAVGNDSVMSLERSMCAAEVENGAPPLPTKQDREKLSALLRRSRKGRRSTSSLRSTSSRASHASSAANSSHYSQTDSELCPDYASVHSFESGHTEEGAHSPRGLLRTLSASFKRRRKNSSRRRHDSSKHATTVDPKAQHDLEMRVDLIAQMSQYYLGHTSIDEALRQLKGCPDGVFVVYWPRAAVPELTISFIDNGEVSSRQSGLSMGKSSHKFENLSALVNFYICANDEEPHLLRLPWSENLVIEKDTPAMFLKAQDTPLLWFWGEMQLPQFLELVGGEQDGSFAVRESAESGSLELGLRTGGKTRRVNICASSRGCHLEGSNRYFEHVLALMEFYEVHETSDLPCRVRDPIIPRTFRRRTSMHDSRRQSSRMRVSPPKKEKPLQSEASFKAPHHAPLLKQPSDTLQVPSAQGTVKQPGSPTRPSLRSTPSRSSLRGSRSSLRGSRNDINNPGEQNGALSSAPWFLPDPSRAEEYIEALTMLRADGAFFIRASYSPSNYILTYWYRNRTHDDLIQCSGEIGKTRVYFVKDKARTFSDLQQLVATYTAKTNPILGVPLRVVDLRSVLPAISPVDLRRTHSWRERRESEESATAVGLARSRSLRFPRYSQDSAGSVEAVIGTPDWAASRTNGSAPSATADAPGATPPRSTKAPRDSWMQKKDDVLPVVGSWDELLAQVDAKPAVQAAPAPAQAPANGQPRAPSPPSDANDFALQRMRYQSFHARPSRSPNVRGREGRRQSEPVLQLPPTAALRAAAAATAAAAAGGEGSTVPRPPGRSQFGTRKSEMDWEYDNWEQEDALGTHPLHRRAVANATRASVKARGTSRDGHEQQSVPIWRQQASARVNGGAGPAAAQGGQPGSSDNLYKSPNIPRRSGSQERIDWAWNQIGTDQKEALEVLLRLPDGGFIIRQSPSMPEIYMLSYIDRGRMYHERITGRSHDLMQPGVRLASSSKEFANVHELLFHHRKPRKELPVALLMPFSLVALQSPARQRQLAPGARGRGSNTRLVASEPRQIPPTRLAVTAPPGAQGVGQAGPVAAAGGRVGASGAPTLATPQGAAPPHRVPNSSSVYDRWSAGAQGVRDLSNHPCIDADARRAYWFCLGLPQVMALDRLKDAATGDFVLRDSPDYFATLTMVVGLKLYQAHIRFKNGLVGLRKSGLLFPTLSAMVEHYQRPDQGDLPVPLRRSTKAQLLLTEFQDGIPYSEI